MSVLNPIPGPYIRTPVANLAAYLAANIGSSTSTASITALLSSYIIANPPAALPLTAINPDFESNKAEMLNVLAGKPSWSDTITAGVGQTISEMIATATTFNQLSIEKGVQESIIDTAVLDSSIYGITRMLGVKIQRRIPGGCTAKISCPISATTTLTIPAYTQLQLSGFNYFNRTPIIIPASANWSANTVYSLTNTVYPITVNGYTYVCTTAGTSGTTEPVWPLVTNGTVTDGTAVWTLNSVGTANVLATIYEGQISSLSFTTSGVPFQIFEFGNSDFSISNVDINVTVTSPGGAVVSYENAVDTNGLLVGLWEYTSSDAVFEETTNAAGNVEIKFGNGTFGQLPLPNSNVTVSFVTTNGQEGNSNLNGQAIICPAFPTITGIATSSTSQGTDQLSAFDYKNLGPGLFAAKRRAVTPQDYASIATTYPGVIDAIFLGQSVFQPTNLAYMMNVQAILLTNTVWTTAQWQAFVTYMANLGCVNIVLLQVVPTVSILNISLDVYCVAQSDLNSVQNQIIANLQAAFTLGVGSLGYSWYKSDINRIVENTSALIDYLDITLPTIDDTITQYFYIQLGTITVNMHYSTRPLKQ